LSISGDLRNEAFLPAPGRRDGPRP
jgi:hypothetical protein